MRYFLLFFLPSLACADFSCFETAAQHRQVPSSLLRAIAKEETDGFHNIPDPREQEGDHLRVYGIMGLRDDGILGRSLSEAAAVSRIPRERLIQDACANIDGAAALLADARKRNGGDLGRAVAQIWGEEAASEVARLLGTGAHDGRVRFAPSAELASLVQPALRISLRPPVRAGSPDEAGATWDPSPNFDANANKALYIVMHTTEGGFAGSVSWLKTPSAKVSAHYVVRKSDGFIKQLVHEKDKAWHARCWNGEAIGIEMEGFLADSSTFTTALLTAASKLAHDIAKRHGIKTDNLHIIGHNFGDTNLIKQTPLQACNDHTDPGPHFPWTRFLQMVK